MEDLQSSAQIWNDLHNLGGGSLAFHKECWHLLVWEVINGELKLLKSTKEQLLLHDGKGAYAIIKFLAPNEPNVGLGYQLCPYGS